MDWFAAITGIAGSIIIMKDVRVATFVWLISNVAFIIWGVYTQTYSVMTMNIVYLIINTITITIRWRKP